MIRRHASKGFVTGVIPRSLGLWPLPVTSAKESPAEHMNRGLYPRKTGVSHGDAEPQRKPSVCFVASVRDN